MLPTYKPRSHHFAFAAIGALGFWLPDLIVHIVSGKGFDTAQLRLVTLVMPASLLITYLFACRVASNHGYVRPGVAMMLGVWLTGGLFTTLSSTAAGGAFAHAGGTVPSLIMIVAGVITIFTSMFATYDGSLFALVIVTVGALVIYAARESGFPISFRRPAQR